MWLARTRLSSSYVGLLYCGVAMGCAALLGLDDPLPGLRAEGSDAAASGDSGLQPGMVDAEPTDVDGAADATSTDSYCMGWSFCDTFSGRLQSRWLPDSNSVYTKTFGNPAGALSLTSPTAALLLFDAGARIKVEFDVFFDPAADGPFFEFSALTGCDVVLSQGTLGTVAFIQGSGTMPIPLKASTWHHVVVDFLGTADSASTLSASFNSIDVTTARPCGALLTERSVRFVARTGGPVWVDNVRIQD